MAKKHKMLILITSVVVLLPIFVGLALWNQMPDQIATHFGADGQADGWSSKATAVFFLPIFILIMHILCAFITSLDPKKQNIGDKVYIAVLWICPVVSAVAAVAVYAPYIGLENINSLVFANLMLALMFIALGNYMPKSRQNYTIGFKISWALEDEDNWNKTHRFAGWLWVLGGLVLLVNTFFGNMVVMVAVIMILSIAPIIYSGMYYAKKKKGN